MPVQGVIFDLGWTLIRYTGDVPSTRRAGRQALVDCLVREGVVMEAAAFLTRFGERLSDYERQRQADFLEFTMAWVVAETLKDLGLPPATAGQITRAVRALYVIIERHWEARPEVGAVLDELAQSGLRMAMFSNAADEGDVRRLITQCGFDGRFDPILISAALGIRKPNPRGFKLILANWDISPSAAVMVGDILGADILGAQNAGVHNIWFDTGVDTPGNLAHGDTIQPEFTARSLSEVPAIIQAIP
ncbi:MAG: HAD family hydrolase [Chloroflexi bacterium]|nr:HAD family hydrolase [Chloroflexota bacterium]